ncbi:MAG: TonB-dependent receptor domain-containing protein, partial [Gammaproteobacteria bacterium]
NFRRPGAGDPLLAGESAGWIFNKGSVTDYFGQAAAETGALDPDMFSAIRIRGTDANGFWGVSAVDFTGAGPLNRVFVQAPEVVDPDAVPPGTPAPVVVPPPALTPDEDVSGSLLLERVCGGGAGGGDGTGGGDGDGSGGNRVERLTGFTFGQRLLSQERAVEVLNSALEVSAEPFAGFGLVAGVGHHWQADDEGEIASDVSYNFGGTYRYTQGLRVKASYARKVRPPSIAQLYDPASGNSHLRFEASDLIEVGFRHVFKVKSSVEFTLFKQNVEGLVQRDVVSGIFQNIAETDFKGLEITGSTAVIPRLRLDVAYTHLVSRDESPGSARKQQQYTPENTVNFTANYQLAERVDFNLSFQRVADQVFYSRATPLTRRDLDAYELVDLHLNYALPGKRLAFHFGIDNVLDADYAESYGLPQAGRFVYVGFNVKLL